MIAVTLPLIPVFGVLIGLYTKAHTDRQWRLLAALGGHFLDVVEGLPTLKLFGRARAQAAAIGRTTDQHRSATMAALRVAFLSALVLELAGALATALVAVEVGLRLLAGHLGYDTALLVLLLTPEAYLPLRNVGAQFHASAEGTTAAGRVLQILDTPLPESSLPAAGARSGGPVRQPDLARDAIELQAVTLRYPGRDVPALDGVTATIRPGEHVLLTGASGAGKSSLLGLLLRFTEPTSGEITAGRTTIAAIPAGGWRRQIAWVPQQSVPVRRDHRREHRARRAGRDRSRDRAGRATGRCRGLHRGAARRLRHPAQRARTRAVRRPAPADRPGPGVPARRAAGAARRADRAPRPRDRQRHPGRAWHGPGRAHGGDDQPPACSSRPARCCSSTTGGSTPGSPGTASPTPRNRDR